jgi:hypothetical protein
MNQAPNVGDAHYSIVARRVYVLTIGKPINRLFGNMLHPENGIIWRAE